MNRRDFIRDLSATAGLAALAGCKSGMWRGRARYAVQLYSIRDIIWEKPEWCLERLKAAGFDGVEFAKYGGRSARDLRRLLANAGMTGMGTHVNGDVFLVGDELKRTLDFCAEAGIESVTTPHAKRDSEDGYRRFGCAMGQAAETAAAYGIKVGIHTTYHHFETRYGDRTAWDVIFSEASPRLMQQIDTSNTFHTGMDIVALLRKYRGRHHSVHLKENTPSRTATLGERPTDGGALVPWRAVMGELATESILWYVIEAETIPDSLDPLVNSLSFIKQYA